MEVLDRRATAGELASVAGGAAGCVWAVSNSRSTALAGDVQFHTRDEETGAHRCIACRPYSSGLARERADSAGVWIREIQLHQQVAEQKVEDATCWR